MRRQKKRNKARPDGHKLSEINIHRAGFLLGKCNLSVPQVARAMGVSEGEIVKMLDRARRLGQGSGS